MLSVCMCRRLYVVCIAVGLNFVFCFVFQVLYLLGALSLSMALQLDRHGLWNLLGPSLFALGIMAVAWVRVNQIYSQEYGECQGVNEKKPQKTTQ